MVLQCGLDELTAGVVEFYRKYLCASGSEAGRIGVEYLSSLIIVPGGRENFKDVTGKEVVPARLPIRPKEGRYSPTEMGISLLRSADITRSVYGIGNLILENEDVKIQDLLDRGVVGLIDASRTQWTRETGEGQSWRQVLHTRWYGLPVAVKRRNSTSIEEYATRSAKQ